MISTPAGLPGDTAGNPGAPYPRGSDQVIESFRGGVSSEACTISSTAFLKSSSPVEGMMMVSRLPLTSSVIRKNRPRGFSLSVRMKDLRSI